MAETFRKYYNEVDFSAESLPVKLRDESFNAIGTESNPLEIKTNFFLPYSEVGVQNGSFSLPLGIPTKFVAGVDIKISGMGTSATANIMASTDIRGWLE